MRKFGLVLIIGFAAAGMASAQSWAAQIVTVSGKLQLQNGMIAVVNGGAVYYVPGLARFIGFIDGLKEGAQVSVDGYAGQDNYMQAVKLTIGAKTYDLIPTAPRGMPYNGYGPGWCH